MAFTCLVFVFSCSFTGAVFNTENVYFMDNTQTVSVAMDSDIELAVEKEVSPIEIDDSEKVLAKNKDKNLYLVSSY